MSAHPSKAIELALLTNYFHFRDPNEPDKIFSKAKKIEVIYAIISKGIPLFRTEGVGDINILELRAGGSTFTVPVILPEKIQAKLRRIALEILRKNFDESMKEVLQKYKDLGYLKVSDSWNCFIAPPSSEGEPDVGMCGYCPACNIFGTIITKKENEKAKTASYGIKSRVLHDVSYALTIYEKAVVDMTHNKTGDGVSYTGRSLFEEPHVVPGVVFVGKIALYDVTQREAKLVLAALANIRRMGAGETKYGEVQTVILGIKGTDFETASSYDIARHVLAKYNGDLLEPEVYLNEIIQYLKNKGFETIQPLGDSAKIDNIQTQIGISKGEIAQLWETDNYNHAKRIVELIRRVEGREGGSTKEGGRRGRGRSKSSGEEG